MGARVTGWVCVILTASLVAGMAVGALVALASAAWGFPVGVVVGLATSLVLGAWVLRREGMIHL